jgi:hypothetical protein
MGKMFFEQPKAKKVKDFWVRPKGETYRREPFIKKVFGKVREFANRNEYKEFYYANRRTLKGKNE